MFTNGASFTGLTVMLTVSVSTLCSAAAGVTLVVGRDLQAGCAVEIGCGRKAQSIERRIEVGQRAGEGHHRVGDAVARGKAQAG